MISNSWRLRRVAQQSHYIGRCLRTIPAENRKLRRLASVASRDANTASQDTFQIARAQGHVKGLVGGMIPLTTTMKVKHC